MEEHHEGLQTHGEQMKKAHEELQQHNEDLRKSLDDWKEKHKAAERDYMRKLEEITSHHVRYTSVHAVVLQ